MAVIVDAYYVTVEITAPTQQEVLEGLANYFRHHPDRIIFDLHYESGIDHLGRVVEHYIGATIIETKRRNHES